MGEYVEKLFLSYYQCFPLCQGEKGDPGLMGLPGARGPIGPRV